MSKNKYISDTHFNHNNILKYCDRPFKDVNEMNDVIFRNLLEAEAQGFHIVHLGDVSFNLQKFVREHGWLKHPERHVFVCGNHDRLKEQFEMYRKCFGLIIGRRSTWKEHFVRIVDDLDGKQVTVICSHAPIKRNSVIHGNYSLYGHVHNNGVVPDPDYLARNPDRVDDDYSFVLDDSTYINVCVEVNDYTPKTLPELIANHEHNVEKRANYSWLMK